MACHVRPWPQSPSSISCRVGIGIIHALIMDMLALCQTYMHKYQSYRQLPCRLSQQTSTSSLSNMMHVQSSQVGETEFAFKSRTLILQAVCSMKEPLSTDVTWCMFVLAALVALGTCTAYCARRRWIRRLRCIATFDIAVCIANVSCSGC